MAAIRKTGVVLFNLGGPDGPDAIKPFLFNLFNDPAIINLPTPLRYVLAKIITARRTPEARLIYEKIGGGSPLVQQTEAQARALETRLQETAPDTSWKVVIAMRYWRPFAHDAAKMLSAFAPDEIVMMPLYPQYSTTTTASSVADWRRAARAAGLDVPARLVCCYGDDPGFIRALCAGIGEDLKKARGQIGAHKKIRLLLSAHGLPQRVIDGGDPYALQVEGTAAAIRAELGTALDGVEVIVCYQSRVGPLQWIGPAADAEVIRAASDGAGIVIAPIAFVSEHSETLVELDMDYAKLARDGGAPCYIRTPTPGTREDFIATLGRLVVKALSVPPVADSGGAVVCGDGGRCGREITTCPNVPIT